MHHVNITILVVLCTTTIAVIVAANPVKSSSSVKETIASEPTEEEYQQWLKEEVEADKEPLTDEQMQMLSNMEREEDVSDDNQDSASVELQVDPEEESVEEDEIEPEQMQEEAPKVVIPDDKDAREKKMKLTGQREYATFTDPEYSAAAVRSNQPTVDVKRFSDRELHFSDMNQLTTNGNMIFVGVVGICAVVAMVGTVIAGVAYYKLHAQAQAAKEINPAAFAKDRRHVTSAIRGQTARGDQKNAYSAQLHHYQQTKSEIIRMEQAGQAAVGGRVDHEHSDESDVEVDEADYSVYECPGLAPTGDIEVANPMFTNEHK